MRVEVVERFLSVQGEGLLVGTPAYFIRLARCNLRCPWCDTKYSWSPGEELEADELAEETFSKGVPLVVITGGEPLLQQAAIARFVRALRGYGFNGMVQIETNATIYPKALEGLDVWITMSPKVTCDYYAAKPDVVKAIARNFKRVELKLVARPSDLACVKRFLKEIGGIEVPKVLQPLSGEGDYAKTSRELVMKVLEDEELRREFRVIPQLHKFLKID